MISPELILLGLFLALVSNTGDENEKVFFLGVLGLIVLTNALGMRRFGVASFSFIPLFIMSFAILRRNSEGVPNIAALCAVVSIVVYSVML